MSVKEHSSDSHRQLVLGVVVNWAVQIIQIAAGFLVPRFIDHQLGREILGIWDLSWSLVSYFSLLTAGVGSTVNRHVALYRATNDVASLNRMVSSVALMQRIVACVVFILVSAFAWTLPFSFGQHSPALTYEARWLVFILGTSLSVSIAGAVYGGVVSGCHRWLIFHGANAVTSLLSLVGMCLVIRSGRGLIALASVHFGTELLGRIIRASAAYRICPELRIRMSDVDSATLRKMVGFGGKMFLGRMSMILLNQTASVLIAAHLGPAALALFSRPRSLVRQASVFPQRYANMLVPAAAKLLGKGNQEELRKFAKDSMRYGLFGSLPLLLFLAVCGGPLLHLWMGPHYANAILMAILSLGFLAEVVYQPLNNVLFGLDLHGPPAIASVVGAAIALLSVSLVLNSKCTNLNYVALSLVIPWSLAHGLYLPAYACRRLGLSLSEFLVDIWGAPLTFMIPFVLCLLGGRLAYPASPLAAVVAGGSLGGVVLGICYWIWVLPQHWKDKIQKRLGRIQCFGLSPFSALNRHPIKAPAIQTSESTDNNLKQIKELL